MLQQTEPLSVTCRSLVQTRRQRDLAIKSSPRLTPESRVSRSCQLYSGGGQCCDSQGQLRLLCAGPFSAALCCTDQRENLLRDAESHRPTSPFTCKHRHANPRTNKQTFIGESHQSLCHGNVLDGVVIYLKCRYWSSQSAGRILRYSDLCETQLI